MATAFQNKVYELCKKVPRGKVTTYKEIAKAMKTKAYRAVGQALRRNPWAPNVPCHRVVCSDGSLGGFMGKRTETAVRKKILLLKKEKVVVKNGKIVQFYKNTHILNVMKTY